MNITQVSVFLENRKGRLAEVSDVLGRAGINIRALSLADTADFGVLRIIVDDPDACKKALKEHGFVVQETDVIGIEVNDKPGGLHTVLSTLEGQGINVEYMYATVEKNGDSAVVIFKVDAQQKAIDVLKKHGIAVIKSDKLKKVY